MDRGGDCHSLDNGRPDRGGFHVRRKTAADSHIRQLLTEISRLRAECARLSRLEIQSAPTDSVAELTIQLTVLSAELASLEQSLTARSAYVSIDDLPAGFRGAAESSAESPETPRQLDVSGFFEIRNTLRNSGADRFNFELNQTEVDLASSLTSRATASLAIAYNTEARVFEVGAAEVGYVGYESSHGTVRRIAVSGGQFDVPFGVDYRVYAAPERALISRPLVVDLTHAGWNDLGVRAEIEGAHFNAVLYGVNGFASSAEVIDRAQTLATGIDTYVDVDTSPRQAAGARLGVLVHDGLEIGGSAASGLNAVGTSEMLLAGLDLQLQRGPLALTGEFIYHSLNRTVAREDNRGLYVQAVYSLPRLWVAGRFGSVQPEQGSWYDVTTVGLGYRGLEGLQVRLETRFEADARRNSSTLQVVVSI